jgi:hypothetical protein
MPQPEVRAWWDDVQHVRESIERRRARAGAPAAVADGPAETDVEARFRRRDAEPALDALISFELENDGARAGDGLATAATRRFERGPRAARATRADAPARGMSRGHSDGEPGDGRSHRSRLEGDEPRTRRAAAQPPAAGRGANGPRRTVQITGRPVGAPALPRLVEIERRRPPRRPVDAVGPRPDRVAMWAVLLGFFLILVAAASSL